MATQTNLTSTESASGQLITTRDVVVRDGLLDDVGSLIRDLVPRPSVMLIADATTWRIAGERAQASLEAAGVSVQDVILLEGVPQVTPDLRNVALIRDRLSPESTPIAVGSGTINDLVKRAAWEADLPYMVLATAASMDGYTASGAALVVDGVKQTLPCNAPVAVLADIAILAAAPKAMTASGYGDLLGKVTAGADWIIADALGIEPIQRAAWNSVQGTLRDILGAFEAFGTGDADSVEALFHALANSGLAIQRIGSSRVASGSEHQFSHYWEMQGLMWNGVPVSHGFKVGLGSIVSTALYERLLLRDLSVLDIESLVANRQPWEAREAQIRAMHSHPSIVEKCLEESRAKFVSDDVYRNRLLAIQNVWATVQSQLQQQLYDPASLATMLDGAGAISRPEQIGLTLQDIRFSYLAATHIRRRYTVFDFVQDVGLFDELIDEVFGPAGYWGRTSGSA